MALHTDRPRTRRTKRLLTGAIIATSLLSACGSDDDDDSAGSEASAEGEYEIVPDSAVATGYAQLVSQMTQLSADPATADEDALDEVHELWESFEGTVKQNDPDAYLASEEALDAFLEAGGDADGAAMTAATAKMTTTSAAYVAAHPG
jgi:hypothetical protein